MIRANELRIGNKFLMAGGTMLQTVLGISDNTDRGRLHTEKSVYPAYSHLITCKENQNQFHPFEIDGVPITKDWLFKMGWLWNVNTGSYEKPYTTGGDARMNLRVRKDMYGRDSYIMYNYILKALISEEIHYLHQIQNLFFAMTGKELNIEE